jgi:parallel beta-helix repeat protein
MNVFTKTVGCFYLILLSLTATATDYYISNSGNDNNSGTSQGAPFLSVNKLNTLALQPGDRILFKRGERFQGELRVIYSGNASNPITLDAYGTGSLPLISGGEYINGWTSAGGSVYMASCSFDPAMVIHNNELQILGRFPNTSFLTIDAPNGSNGFTDNALTQGNGYFTGSQVHVRSARWRYEERTVQAYNDKSVLFNTAMSFPLTSNWGYFFTNKREFIDAPKEYYYNASTQQLFLQTNNGQPPSNFTVEASKYNYGINLEGSSYITIKNIQFSFQKGYGIFSQGVGSNISITNCAFRNIFNRAIGVITKDNVTISNNEVYDMWSRGITLYKCTNVIMENNTIKRIGIGRPGIATDNELPYLAVQFDRSTGIIRDNIIDSIGYSGIRYGKYTTIERNLISNFCMTTDDGAGIYTWGPVGEPDDLVPNGTGCFIRNNIVKNAFTNTESTANSETFVAGIFMDDFSGYATIENNTVINSERIGLFIHNSPGNIVRNNTVFDCKDAPFGIWHDQVGPFPSNNTISDNIFYNIYDTKQSAIIANYNRFNLNGVNFGIFSGNYYSNPYNAAPIFTSIFLGDGSQVSQNISVEEWKQTKDATAKESFVKFDNYTITSTNSGNLVNNGNFDANLNNWYCYGCSENTWESGGAFDGGYVKLNSPNSFYGSFYNTTYFTIEQAKQYLLSYSVAGPQQGAHTLSFADGVNFATVSDRKIKTFNAARANQKVLLTANTNSTNARANFSIGPPNDAAAFSLDNVSVYQVTTTSANPYDKNFIFTNESNQTKTVPLAATYYDINGAPVSGSISLPAWSSKILVSVQGTPPPPPATPVVSIGDTLVPENIGIAGLKVCLSSASNNVVTVQYQVSHGSATPGADFVNTSGTLTIPAGQTCATIPVSILTDNLQEPTEDIVFTIFNAQNATIGDAYGAINITNVNNGGPLPTVSIGDATVAENAGTGQVNVCLSSVSSQPVTVQYAVSHGSATAGADYISTSGTLTIPAGQTCVPISVTVLADNLAEPTEDVVFVIFNAQNATIGDAYGALNITNVAGGGGTQPTVSIGDASVSENAGTGQLSVCLSAPSAQTVTVQYRVSHGSATAGADYVNINGTLTIPAGQTCAPISVSILPDNLPEPTEDIVFLIFNAQNATVADAYGALNIINANASSPVTVSIKDALSTENIGTAKVDVCLSAVSSLPVSVQYRVSHGSAIAGLDFINTSGTLTIPAGEICGSISVTILPDNISEPTEDIVFLIFNAQGATIDDAYGAINILDNGSQGASLGSLPANNVLMNDVGSKKITVLPNPFVNVVRTIIDVKKEERADIVLLDIYGRIIFAKNFLLVPGKNQLSFDDVSKLKPGNYFLRIATVSGVETHKVSKLR